MANGHLLLLLLLLLLPSMASAVTLPPSLPPSLPPHLLPPTDQVGGAQLLELPHALELGRVCMVGTGRYLASLGERKKKKNACSTTRSKRERGRSAALEA